MTEASGEPFVERDGVRPEVIPAPGDSQPGTGDRGDEAGCDPRTGDGGAIVDETEVDAALGERPGEAGARDASADDEELAVTAHGWQRGVDLMESINGEVGVAS